MLGYVLIITACVLWAIDTLIRYPLMRSGLGAYPIVFVEHLLLTSVFCVVYFKSVKKLWDAKVSHIFYFFVIGGLGSALATLSFTKAFSLLNPSLVILLQKFQPIVAILLAKIVLKEKLRGAFIFWAAICMLGGLFISLEDILNINTSNKSLKEILFHPGAGQGYFLVLISVLGWGSATVYGKKLLQIGYNDEQILAGRFLMGLICLLPFLSSKFSLLSYSLEFYGKVSLMVLVSGVLAMYLYYQGLRKISARACSLTEMFFPFMAVIVNWLVLGATLTPAQLLGGGLLLLGSIIIQLKQY